MFLVLSDPDCLGQILENHNNNIASEFIKVDDLPYPYKFIVPVSHENHSLSSDFPVTVHRKIPTGNTQCGSIITVRIAIFLVKAGSCTVIFIIICIKV